MEFSPADRSAFIEKYDGVWVQMDGEVQRMPYSAAHRDEIISVVPSVRQVLTIDLESETAVADLVVVHGIFPLHQAPPDIVEQLCN
jgi:hypothetical protein